METSNHVPCLITASTNIPKGKIFRFENYLNEHEHFFNVVQHAWSLPLPQLDMAKLITEKFKNVRRVIRAWQSHLSSLKANISNVKLIITFMGLLEEFRDLTLEEWNFRKILDEKLISLLQQQRIYWKQRGKIKWVTQGDAGTKFFHANATIKHRRNMISCLLDQDGNPHTAHPEKADILWEAFKDRLGQSEFDSLAIYEFIVPSSSIISTGMSGRTIH